MAVVTTAMNMVKLHATALLEACAADDGEEPSQQFSILRGKNDNLIRQIQLLEKFTISSGRGNRSNTNGGSRVGVASNAKTTMSGDAGWLFLSLFQRAIRDISETDMTREDNYKTPLGIDCFLKIVSNS